MSTATDGRRREHRVRDHLARHGWRQVMRAAGSKGSADLFVCHAEYGGALVQVGSASKTLGPAERARLIADADDTGCLAILAITPPPRSRQPIRFWQVTLAPPSRWEPWQP